jgi:hypothetical protein
MPKNILAENKRGIYKRSWKGTKRNVIPLKSRGIFLS